MQQGGVEKNTPTAKKRKFFVAVGVFFSVLTPPYAALTSSCDSLQDACDRFGDLRLDDFITCCAGNGSGERDFRHFFFEIV